MFSFHKPRVYRSTQGCCICKAKSSSSRFTDSKKYENDFIECFQLQTPRKGEICNACVLLVKRFKRLPPGSDRHWGHVVDARVGPGLKSMTKFKKRKEESLMQQQQQVQQTNNVTLATTTPLTHQVANSKTSNKYNNMNGNSNPISSCTKSLSSVPERFCKIFKKNKKKKQLTPEVIKRIASPVLSDDVSSPSSPSGDSDDNHKTKEISANQNVIMLNTNYDNTNIIKTISNIFISNNNKDDLHIMNNSNNNNLNNGRIMKNYKRKSYIPYKNNNNNKINNATFIDNNIWKKQLTCCGIIYENKLLNSIVINIDMYKPCLNHINSNNKKKTDYIINQDQININNNTSKIPANIHDEIAIKNDELIRHIKSATNFIMNSSVNTSLQNSSILHHHHHYPSNNNTNVNVNKIGKISDTVNTNTTAMKKHHLYSKRQNNDVIGNAVHNDNTNLIVPIPSSVPLTNVHNIGDNALQILPINSQQQQQRPPQQHTNKYNNYLHKLKETGKIIKNSSSTIINNDKLLTAAVAAASSVAQQSSVTTTSIKNNKNSLQDLNIVKNLVKLCTEKTTKNKLQINNNDSSKNVEILVTNKFSDNSSDSGYEETPQENQQVQQGLQNGQIIRPLVLPNGIKLHVQPQSNLILNSNNNNTKLMNLQHEQQLPQKLQLINKPTAGVSKIMKKDIELQLK